MASYSSSHASRVEARRREAAGAVTLRRPTTLSSLLAQQPGLYNGTKIAAVDRGLTVIDSLPDRLRGITTLYLSKNALRSLEGVEQFGTLRALSVADCCLSDFEVLAPLTQLGLVAASFEGNPLAELPLYRQHAIVALGPALQLLDNRPVSEEERSAARGAVAHERTMLGLMLSNSCLAHKLYRCVQQLRLHVQLQCAVLGGQYGGVGTAGADGVYASGPGMGAVVRLWDYEASLGPAERRAVLLAIRREVARAARRLASTGAARPDSGRLWQQAYAQVSLKQQETIASLMVLLEEAQTEAASVLAPITRPLSPTKRRVVQGGHDAAQRLAHEREELIQELRDAFLGLADASSDADSQARAAQYEGRIHRLHAALESAGRRGQQQQAEAEEPKDGAWSISAVHSEAVLADSAKPAFKSALKKQPGGTPARSPRKPSGVGGGGQPPAADEQRSQQARRPQPQQQQQHSRAEARARPASAARRPPSSRPPTAPAGDSEAQQDPPAAPERPWQPDDSLAVYEEGEQEEQRCTTPRPFRSSSQPSSRPQQPLPPSEAPALSPGGSAASPGRHELADGANGSPCSSPGAVSPSSWTPNPLAMGEGGSKELHDLLARAARKGGREQVRLLQAAVSQYDVSACQLSAANQELAAALAEVRDHALTLEAQLAEEREGAAHKRVEQAATLASMAARLEEAAASQAALRGQVESLQSERTAQAAEVAALRSRVAELEAVDPVNLQLSVSYEEEWKAQCLRSAALESSCMQLSTSLAGFERQARLERASERMGGRVLLLRVLRRWQRAAQAQAAARGLQLKAEAWRERRLTVRWLGAWRQAAAREKLIHALELQRQLRLIASAWQAWRFIHEREVLIGALAAATSVTHDTALLRQCLAAWRERAAACRQTELPDSHPLLQRAAQQQRERLLRHMFSAWRGHMQAEVAPRLQAVRRLAAQCFMGTQLRAWAAWQAYTQERRRSRLLNAVATLHFLHVQFRRWRKAAAEGICEQHEAQRGLAINRVLLTRRAWRAFTQALAMHRKRAAQRAAADAHRRGVLLAEAWASWRRWLELCREARARQASRVAANALGRWRAAVQAAHAKRRAERFCQSNGQARFHAAFVLWREAATSRRLRRQRLAHAQQVLARRRLERLMAGWRRGVLASKLGSALECMGQLQAAVDRVRAELQAKAAEASELESIKVEVEGRADSLSLRVTCLDAELASLRQRGAELEAALEESRAQAAAALAAQQAAETAAAAAAEARKAAEEAAAGAALEREAAESMRDAALAGMHAAEEQAGQAAGARATAEQRAAAADAAATEASTAQAAAEQAAAAAVAEQQRLEEELTSVMAAREQLKAELGRALDELASLTARSKSLEAERAQLKMERDDAVVERSAATAQAAAALRQAEHLAGLIEVQKEQQARLEAQLSTLHERLVGQGQLQEEVAAASRRVQQLQAEVEAARARAEEATALCERVQAEEVAARQTVSQLRAEHAQLLASLEEQGAEVAALRRAAARLEQAEAAARGLAQEKEAILAQLAEVEAERSAAASTAGTLNADKQALEAQMAELREQLESSNSVLEACRGVLSESCARNTADASATLTLQDMLCNLRAELLLKESAIDALTRQAEERSQRLTALQQEIARLRQQIAAGASASAVAAFAAPASALPLSLVYALPVSRQQQQDLAGSASQRGSPASPASPGPRHSTLPSAPPAQQASPGAANTAYAVQPGDTAGMAAALRAASTAAAAPGAHAQRQQRQPARGLSSEEVSFIMELSAQKRLSASQARDLIAAAAGGNLEPWRSVLDAVAAQQQAGQHQQSAGVAMQWQPAAQQQAGQQQMLSPGTAIELAAVRREIQQLQGRS